MILGIGNDLCDIRRIEKTIERYGERFLLRVFTAEERRKAFSRPSYLAPQRRNPRLVPVFDRDDVMPRAAERRGPVRHTGAWTLCEARPMGWRSLIDSGLSTGIRRLNIPLSWWGVRRSNGRP